MEKEIFEKNKKGLCYLVWPSHGSIIYVFYYNIHNNIHNNPS